MKGKLYVFCQFTAIVRCFSLFVPAFWFSINRVWWHQDRLDRSKLAVYYVLLLRWSEIMAFAEQEKIPWPIESTLQDAFNE